MQYVGIALDKPSELLLGAFETADEFDLHIFEDTSLTDIEVREGLHYFCQKFNCTIFKVVRASTKKGDNTSSGVDENLFAYYEGTESNHILNFLKKYRRFLPEKFFLLFGFEWDADRSVRFETISLNDLEGFFKRQRSWYLWLYSPSNNYFYPDLDIPLIIEIVNECYN